MLASTAAKARATARRGPWPQLTPRAASPRTPQRTWRPSSASSSVSRRTSAPPWTSSSAINTEALCAAPPEALAHSPSQVPLSCPVAPPSQRELHQDGGGGVAMRARAARALKAKSCATSFGTSSATPSAASFTCSSFMSPKGRRVGGLASGSPRAAAHHFPLKSCVRRVLYLPALHVPSATATGPAAPTKGFERSKSAQR